MTHVVNNPNNCKKKELWIAQARQVGRKHKDFKAETAAKELARGLISTMVENQKRGNEKDKKVNDYGNKDKEKGTKPSLGHGVSAPKIKCTWWTVKPKNIVDK